MLPGGVGPRCWGMVHLQLSRVPDRVRQGPFPLRRAGVITAVTGADARLIEGVAEAAVEASVGDTRAPLRQPGPGGLRGLRRPGSRRGAALAGPRHGGNRPHRHLTER